LGIRFVPLDNLLSESDIVTLHLPLTPETEHMLGARELDLMKPTAISINTSRGKLINEDALIGALHKKRLLMLLLTSLRDTACRQSPIETR
jgi:phosphoglycerate dehydrogenase-like enzyme